MKDAIEKILETGEAVVYRITRDALQHRMDEVDEYISNDINRDHWCMILQKREDTKINGTADLIKDIPIDFRSHRIIIVRFEQDKHIVG